VELAIGHVSDETAEVVSGVRSGDVVVVRPGSALADGTMIEPRD
jgi:hypothetical protein